MGRRRGQKAKENPTTTETANGDDPPIGRKRNFLLELIEKNKAEREKMKNDGEEIEVYEFGDLVFAKVRGFDPWPARIEVVTPFPPDNPATHIYTVMFFGTHETVGEIPHESIHLYTEENKEKYGKPGKKLKQKFLMGMWEMENCCNILATDPVGEPSLPCPSSGLARTKGPIEVDTTGEDSDDDLFPIEEICQENIPKKIALDVTVSSPQPKRMKLSNDVEETASFALDSNEKAENSTLNDETEDCAMVVEEFASVPEIPRSEINESADFMVGKNDEYPKTSNGETADFFAPSNEKESTTFAEIPRSEINENPENSTVNGESADFTAGKNDEDRKNSNGETADFSPPLNEKESTTFAEIPRNEINENPESSTVNAESEDFTVGKNKEDPKNSNGETANFSPSSNEKESATFEKIQIHRSESIDDGENSMVNGGSEDFSVESNELASPGEISTSNGGTGNFAGASNELLSSEKIPINENVNNPHKDAEILMINEETSDSSGESMSSISPVNQNNNEDPEDALLLPAARMYKKLFPPKQDPEITKIKRKVNNLIHYEVLLGMRRIQSPEFGDDHCLDTLTKLGDEADLERDAILCVPSLLDTVKQIVDDNKSEALAKKAKELINFIVLLFDDIETPLDIEGFMEIFRRKAMQHLANNAEYDYYRRMPPGYNSIYATAHQQTPNVVPLRGNLKR